MTIAAAATQPPRNAAGVRARGVLDGSWDATGLLLVGVRSGARARGPRLPVYRDGAIALRRAAKRSAAVRMVRGERQERLGGVRAFAAFRHTSVPVARRPSSGTFTATRSPARDFRERAAAGQQRHANAHLHRALDAVEARQRNQDVDRGPCAARTARSTRSRAGDGSLCAMTVSRPISSIVTRRRDASGCGGAASRTSSSRAERDDRQPRSGRVERQHAEVEAALEHLARDLAGRHAAHVDGDAGMHRGEARDERQQRVDGGLVGADRARGRAAGRAARARRLSASATSRSSRVA